MKNVKSFQIESYMSVCFSIILFSFRHILFEFIFFFAQQTYLIIINRLFNFQDSKTKKKLLKEEIV